MYTGLLRVARYNEVQCPAHAHRLQLTLADVLEQRVVFISPNPRWGAWRSPGGGEQDNRSAMRAASRAGRIEN